MPMVVHRVRIVVRGVDAEAVVDLAVAVVVDPVDDAVARAPVHVRGQVLMVVIDPGVDHRHDDVAAAGGDVPRLHGVDVRVGDSAALTRVVEPPQLAEARIIGRRLALDDPVGLGVDDRGMAAIRLESRLDAHPGRQPHHVQPLDDREALQDAGAHQRVGEGLLGRRRRGGEPHEHGIRRMAGKRLRRDARRTEQQERHTEDQPDPHPRAPPAHRAGSSRRNVTGRSSRARRIK